MGQRARHAQTAIHLAHQQRAAIAGETAAGKIGGDLAVAEVLKEERLVVTVCGRKGGAGCGHKAQSNQAF